MTGAVERARSVLEGARRLVVVTGAGVSAESGVPTFRGPGGLWKEHRPEELATPGAFARDPRLVWEWYQWRRDLVGGCDPNPAHRVIAACQVAASGSEGRTVTVVTQNVDGLHELALREARGDAAGGSASGEAGAAARARDIVALHGSLFGVRCTACRWRATRREPVDATEASTLPRCPACGALVRPDVVWFGESLDPRVLDAAFAAAAAADVCLVVGTSAVVQPAASIPLATAREGGVVVEVNPDETPLSRMADVVVRGAAGDVLPRLLPS